MTKPESSANTIHLQWCLWSLSYTNISTISYCTFSETTKSWTQWSNVHFVYFSDICPLWFRQWLVTIFLTLLIVQQGVEILSFLFGGGHVVVQGVFWGFPSARVTVKPFAWWRHQMDMFSALLAVCAGNSPVTSDFPSQRPVRRSFNVFFLDGSFWCHVWRQSWHHDYSRFSVVVNHKHLHTSMSWLPLLNLWTDLPALWPSQIQRFRPR